ncbi:Uma2 family endonuclease [Planctomicrobium piriforme]|uniref:Endonuclease, Uma2 family (Restriction endonuclease fold) n=1 Tax=Planctomicrobium piriforme TaxID=1576369 RepID=A0A1I3D4M2_9PLAN|nr:Uma2 family endonuclease [Planctomicrobium piriforme]SFH81626.1 Endonuclease, Uma2 family (restriction endonuclease fold) [Planctomicrobium piriforme]
MSTILDNSTDIPEMDIPETLADVIDRLGGIPLNRIRWQPYPGTATIDDAERAEHCELIDGILVEKAIGQFEGRIGHILAWYLELWMSITKLGFVIGDGAMTRLRTGNMRIPDVYAVRWDRVGKQEVPEDTVTKVIPHVAIEVMSQGNTEREIERKKNEFFANGTEQVWIVRPRTETVDVWTGVSDCVTLTVDDDLDGGNSLPGFKIPVQEIFAASKRGSIDLSLIERWKAGVDGLPGGNP